MPVYICTSSSVERGSFVVLETDEQIELHETKTGETTRLLFTGHDSDLSDALIALGLIGENVQTGPTRLYVVNPGDMKKLHRCEWFRERFNDGGE